MPLNQQKVLRVVLDELESIEERYNGYRKELIASIAEILQAESEHRVSRTNIQKQINDKVNAVARFVAEQQ